MQIKKIEEIIFVINIWISIKGLNNFGYNGFDYPYKALSPVTGVHKEFKSIDDVYEELMNCYQELEDKNIENKSETLYAEHCKAFNTAPYSSLNETPAKVVDEFLAIEDTMKRIKQNKE